MGARCEHGAARGTACAPCCLDVPSACTCACTCDMCMRVCMCPVQCTRTSQGKPRGRGARACGGGMNASPLLQRRSQPRHILCTPARKGASSSLERRSTLTKPPERRPNPNQALPKPYPSPTQALPKPYPSPDRALPLPLTLTCPERSSMTLRNSSKSTTPSPLMSHSLKRCSSWSTL